MELKAASRNRARKILAAGMRCGLGGEGLKISAISECLRAVSYLCSVPERNYIAWEPAASVRLTGMVRRKLAPLWPDLADNGESYHSDIMTGLNSLAELGDMVKLKEGRWLIAPPHVVRVGDGLAVLLGGGPMELLPTSLAARVAGRVRFVMTAACEGWAELWEAEEWVGAPVEGLEAWSARLLTEASVRLKDAPDNLGEVFVYLYRKWVRLEDSLAGEGPLLLCRTSNPGVAGPIFSYFIGEFVRKRLRRLSSIEFPDARRLRFYLDAQAGRPVRAMATASNGLVKLRLGRRLPNPEARILLLGWQVPPPEGEHPGITHHMFPLEVLPILRKAFEGLGIILDERCGAER